MIRTAIAWIAALALCTGNMAAQAKDKRTAVPDAASQQKAEKLVKELFQEEYAKKSVPDRLALAAKLLEQARETKDDLAARFVLLREARDLAAQAGDSVLAFQAIDRLAKEYAVQGLSMKTAVLEAVKKSASDKIALATELFEQSKQAKNDAAVKRLLYEEALDLAAKAGEAALAQRIIDEMAGHFPVNALALKAGALEIAASAVKTPAGFKMLVESALVVIEEALAVDDFVAAGRLLKVALAAAKNSKNGSLISAVQVHAKEIETLDKGFEAVKKARETLAKNPMDGDGNLVVGRYDCFAKGRWAAGLPMLTLGSDGKLRELAAKDLAAPKAAAERVEVGDGWWDLAEAEKGYGKAQIHQRAYHWYNLAVPELSGLTRTKVEKRITQLAKQLPKAAVFDGLPLKAGGFGGRTGAARVRLLMEGGGNAASEAAVARGLAWIVAHQAPDGRWSLDGFNQHGNCRCTGFGQRNEIAGTVFGLLPLLGAGEHHRNPKAIYGNNVLRGLKYLIEKQKLDGDFGGGMYAHGLATIAMCEAYGLTADPALQKPAQKALNYIRAAQHGAGGWRYQPRQAGDTSVVGWQVMALKSGQMGGLEVDGPNSPTFAKAMQFLDAVMSTDGRTYGYTGKGGTPTMTSVGLLCRQYMGWGPRNVHLLAGVETLKQNAPGRLNSMYYYYYATQVMHHLGGDDWKAWNEKMRDLLVARQDKGDKNPHARGSWNPAGDGHGNAGGRLMMTSLSLLTLEVYYRHVRLYGAEPKPAEGK